MMVMPSLPSLLSLLTNSAVLVPAVTATVLPRKPSAVLMSLLVRVIHLNCGTKNVGKSDLRLSARHIGRRAAFDVDRAIGDERKAGGRRHRIVFDAQIRHGEFRLHGFYHVLAQLDREPDRLQLVVKV